MDKVLLINPVSTVHDRNINIFSEFLPEWKLRRLYNPNLKWFYDKKNCIAENAVWFLKSGRLPGNVFDNVKAVVLFSAQPRIPHLNLIQEAALRKIPVIAVEEVYQMAFEQGYVNEYFIPVDRLLAASEYERKRFIAIGIAEEAVETTGCIFRYSKPQNRDMQQREELKRRLRVSADKKIATLCLAYLSNLGETLEIRKRLLKILSEGLPEEYELIIKPHPAEDDANFAEFVNTYAPGAKIVNQHISINELLGITDVLFNRGNSQVLIDAIQRDIAVAVIPVGRKILFNTILEEVIVKRSEDVRKVLEHIQRMGTGLYKRILEYFPIIPEEAVRKTIARIKQIAEDGELYKPEERLVKISLFWAWAGYSGEAKKLLTLTKARFDRAPCLDEAHRLLSHHTDRKAINVLKKWLNGSYMEWILQSLWVRTLYETGRKMMPEDKEWLVSYPPLMNREAFFPYFPLLYWSYVRSGMQEEGSALLERFHDTDTPLKHIELRRLTKNERYNDAKDYWYWRLKHSAWLLLKNLTYRVGQVTDYIPREAKCKLKR